MVNQKSHITQGYVKFLGKYNQKSHITQGYVKFLGKLNFVSSFRINTEINTHNSYVTIKYHQLSFFLHIQDIYLNSHRLLHVF